VSARCARATTRDTSWRSAVRPIALV
jgi:hypothetical protein